jgi:RNA recognition motif-containing protein
MYDPTTGASRGYGFVRFGEESDMHRALALGHNSSGTSGLTLRGRTLRISEASGSGGLPRGRTTSESQLTTGSRTVNIASLQLPPPSNQPTPPHHLSLASPSPTFSTAGSALVSGGAGVAVTHRPTPSAAAPPASGLLNLNGDPNNTTVFVGGLPSCIGEETLKVSQPFIAT